MVESYPIQVRIVTDLHPQLISLKFLVKNKQTINGITRQSSRRKLITLPNIIKLHWCNIDVCIISKLQTRAAKNNCFWSEIRMVDISYIDLWNYFDNLREETACTVFLQSLQCWKINRLSNHAMTFTNQSWNLSNSIDLKECILFINGFYIGK